MPCPHGVCSLVGETEICPVKGGKCFERAEQGKRTSSAAVRAGFSKKEFYSPRSERMVSESFVIVVGTLHDDEAPFPKAQPQQGEGLTGSSSGRRPVPSSVVRAGEGAGSWKTGKPCAGPSGPVTDFALSELSKK